MTRKTNVLSGHTLRYEGAAFTRHEDGNFYVTSSGSQNGAGHGKCWCGVLSPPLPNRAARKQWHREHKDEIRRKATP